MVETEKRAAFLKKIHLFQGFSNERLDEVANALQEQTFNNEEQLYAVGDPSNSFFLVYAGNVILQEKKKFVAQSIKLVSGDYFGVEIMNRRAKRESTAIAQPNAVLFTLTREQFLQLTKESQNFKSCIEAIATSRKLMETTRFNWLKPDETIYLLTRKHPIVLYQMLVGPALGTLAPIFFLSLWLLSASSIPLILGIAALIADLAWLGWAIMDFGNDYYVITDRRVIWLEKVIGLYESRQESPLSMIMPVSVETGVIGRMFDFGDVIVRTYTSRIVLKHVERPYQVAAMVEEYRGRTQAVMREQEVEKMKTAIRTKLGLIQPQAKPAPPPPAPPKRRVNIPRLVLSELFKMRIEDGSVIIYRKHWYVLIQQSWAPSFFILLDFVLSIINLFTDFGQDKLTTEVLLFTAFLPLAVWWIYEFIDWRNDRFEVTPEQILDIDKKPLGLEQRKSAKLEDILSIEYRRVGISGILLNYGTVYIMVGNTEFTFDDVHDPALVQSEVEERRNSRIIQKRETEVAAERERVADWLATYHRSAEELRRETGLSENE